MVSKIYSSALQGLEAELIEVETAVNQGLRVFNIVGLADTAIKEAKQRVGSAVKSAGLTPPQVQPKRVLTNLAPADLKKQGALYDLAIALGYLLSDQQIAFEPQGKLILGELALDGQLKPIKGALSFALLAQQKGFTEIILPKANVKEAALSKLAVSQSNAGADLAPASAGQDPLKIIGAENLKQVIHHLERRALIVPTELDWVDLKNQPASFEVDLSWIKGQAQAKRALKITAAGGHNLLLLGPPGAGKTLLAKAMLSILPALSPQELLEITKIYSLAGLSSQGAVFQQRPFRSPHHTASEPALIGGGSLVRPGEITLSHRGVLFLDEFPEFHRDVLESLRQPLEQGIISIQRAKSNFSFPANFTLIAASNPCPCGFYQDPNRECTCTSSQIASYRRKLSGPLMDRFDLFCWVPAVKFEELIEKPSAKQSPAPTESEQVRQKVAQARQIQKERLQAEGLLTNAEMQPPQLKKYCPIDSNSGQLLKKFVDQGKLSARGFHRILKVARTIADLDQKTNIAFQDVAEALSFRQQNLMA